MTYEVRDGWLYGELPGPDGPIPVERYSRGTSSRLAKNPPNLCLHTTEGSSTLGDAYKRWEYPPNAAVGDGRIVQLFPFGYASRAVDSKDAYLFQIEIPFRVAGLPSPQTVWLPPASSLYPLVALVAFLHRKQLITTGLRRPNDAWPLQLDRGPQASESYYRRRDGTWPRDGVYGHVEIPDDEHWDPGSFNYPKFFEMVRELLEADDMAILTDEEQKALRNFLANLRTRLGDAPAGTAGNRVGDAVRAVEAGDASTPSEPHSHPHVHPEAG